MRFRFLLVSLLFIISTGIQADDLEGDTITLEGITITGNYFERFGAGSTIQKIDSIYLSSFSDLNLNDLIKACAPIHFKSYGSSMLSSVSFRGTGSGHTAIFWNGVNVNQPTVGQSDFSLFPVFAFEDIKIHYGAASSRYGSDAIGGSILLDSKPDWNQHKLKGSLGFLGGSYDNYLSKADVTIRPFEKVLSTSKIYINTNKNDFQFRNITKPGKPLENQQNASVFQYGVIQDLYVKITEKSQFSLNSWFNYSDRAIQPTMTDIDGKNKQKDRSLRIVANYHTQTNIGFFESRLGYLSDYLVYNEQSVILSRQHLGQLAYEHDVEKWKFRIGTSYNHIRAESENFEDDQSENRSNVYGGVVYAGLPETEISLNINQQIISGYQTPLAPSLGFRYRIYTSTRTEMSVEGQASLNYRVPSLNDRYWKPGGRENLHPERSQNADGTITFHHSGKAAIKLSLAGYFYRVKDWILWMPAGNFWRPDNVRRVNASGFEIQTSIRYPLGKSLFELNGYFSLSHSIIQESETENDRSIGSQLPYTPGHMAGVSGLWKNSYWNAGIFAEYTGKTYLTTDNQSELPGYLLVNILASRNITAGHQFFVVKARINNLFNKEYQNVLYRAMPARTYMIGVNFLFNH